LKPFLENKRGGKILEMGCGDSYMLSYFGKEYGMRVYGIEYSPKRMMSAWLKLGKHGIGGKLKSCDFNNILEKWIGQFDIVYAGGVVEHFKEPSEILKIFSVYLKANGYLITTSPYLGGTIGKLVKRIDEKVYDAHKIMDLNEFIKEHEKAGLKVYESKYFMWCGFDMVNFSSLPIILRKVVYGCITLVDMVLKYAMQFFGFDRMPFHSLYSQMFVVAKKI
jgi:cyclopropane fatty-acyl-phospholipid synthase-like methyltransferase